MTALLLQRGPQLTAVGLGGAVEFELRGARLLEIKRHEVREPRVMVHLLQGAVGGHHTAFHQADAVGELQGGMPVGDHEDGDIGQFLADRAEDAVLGGGIDRGGRIIEHEHPRPRQERPGQRDALPLPTGERQSTFTDHLAVTVGELVDELMCLRHLSGPLNLLVGDIEPHRDVVADGGGVEKRLIEDGDEVAADIGGSETVEGQLAALGIQEGQRALLRLVEGAGQLHRHGLARSGRAHQHHGLPGIDREIQTVEDAPEVHIGQAQAEGLIVRDGDGVHGVVVRGFQINDLEDSLH